jgi:hypothetical protein
LVVTLGIYQIVWLYRSTQAIRRKGAEIPHFALFFIPLANIYWFYCYAKALDRCTQGRIDGTLSFLLLLFLDGLALFFLQHQINQFERSAQALS